MRLQDLLGLELPIIQAPMAGAQGSALAIAVSQAGGLGSLPCAMLDANGIRKELAAIREQTTKPVNVNFFCHAQPEADLDREKAWLDALAPYFDELGIDASTVVAGAGRLPFSAELADVLDEFKPAVVSFHFGLPSPELMDRVRGCGAKIFSSATTVDEARWLEARGVDAVIAQGLEAGGHRGHFLSHDLTRQMGTFALVPQVVKAVKIPVIAAGGIADAEGIKAAIALGAAGVQIGTVVLAVSRSDNHPLASCRLEERCRSRHRAHQRLHRAAGPRHRQSHHQGNRPAVTRGAGVSTCHLRDRALAREGRKQRKRRFLADVGGAECQWVQRGAGCRPDKRVW